MSPNELADRLEQTLKVMKSSRLKGTLMSVWPDDAKNVEEALAALHRLSAIPAEPGAWRYCPECGSEEIRHEEGRHKQCGKCFQEWFEDVDYSDVVQKNLARLAALNSATPAQEER